MLWRGVPAFQERMHCHILSLTTSSASNSRITHHAIRFRPKKPEPKVSPFAAPYFLPWRFSHHTGLRITMPMIQQWSALDVQHSAPNMTPCLGLSLHNGGDTRFANPGGLGHSAAPQLSRSSMPPPSNGPLWNRKQDLVLSDLEAKPRFSVPSTFILSDKSISSPPPLVVVQGVFEPIGFRCSTNKGIAFKKPVTSTKIPHVGTDGGICLRNSNEGVATTAASAPTWVSATNSPAKSTMKHPDLRPIQELRFSNVKNINGRNFTTSPRRGNIQSDHRLADSTNMVRPVVIAMPSPKRDNLMVNCRPRQTDGLPGSTIATGSPHHSVYSNDQRFKPIASNPLARSDRKINTSRNGNATTTSLRTLRSIPELPLPFPTTLGTTTDRHIVDATRKTSQQGRMIPIDRHLLLKPNGSSSFENCHIPRPIRAGRDQQHPRIPNVDLVTPACTDNNASNSGRYRPGLVNRANEVPVEIPQECDTTETASVNLIDLVIPCDVAYVDRYHGDGLELNKLTLECDQERVFNPKKRSFQITNSHSIRYKGEIIWSLVTTRHGNSKGMRGDSSSCYMSDPTTLQVRMIHKAGGVRQPSRISLDMTTTPTTQRTLKSLSITKSALDLRELLEASVAKYKSEASTR